MPLTNNDLLDPITASASTVGATTTEPAQANAPELSVSSEQTTAGQMGSLLKSDNPYMKQAATQGKQFAASRGLLNSSMAAGASQGAAIERAMPIAQSDANLHAQAAQFNTENQTRSNQFNAGEQNRIGMFNADSTNAANQFNANAFNEMAKLGLQINANERQLPMAFAQNMSVSISDGVNAIIADGTLTGPAKQAAIKNLVDYGNSQISWASAFYNIAIPSISAPNMA